MNYRTITQLSIAIALAIGSTGFQPAAWQSKFVKESNGTLIYTPDSKGDQLPDFSKVGYHKGEVEIPDVAVVKTISPPAKGDAQELLQSAIDEVAKMPLNSKGFRGAILLKKGTYRIPGKINIGTGGIVLRGEGANEQGTILVASGKGQRNLLNISGSSSSVEIKGTRVDITDAYVPVGSFSFRVENVKGFHAGDAIVLLRPGTEKWIHELKMDQIEQKQGTKQ